MLVNGLINKCISKVYRFRENLGCDTNANNANVERPRGRIYLEINEIDSLVGNALMLIFYLGGAKINDHFGERRQALFANKRGCIERFYASIVSELKFMNGEPLSLIFDPGGKWKNTSKTEGGHGRGQGNVLIESPFYINNVGINKGIHHKVLQAVIRVIKDFNFEDLIIVMLTTKDLRKIMGLKHNICNMLVIAHMDFGQSLFTGYLVVTADILVQEVIGNARMKIKRTNEDERGFVQFHYESMKQIYNICVNDQKDKPWPMLRELGVTKNSEENSVIDVALVKCVLQTWLSESKMLMGKKHKTIDGVPHGNRVTVTGLDQCFMKNATLTNDEEVDACRIRTMKFFISSIAHVAVFAYFKYSSHVVCIHYKNPLAGHPVLSEENATWRSFHILDDPFSSYYSAGYSSGFPTTCLRLNNILRTNGSSSLFNLLIYFPHGGHINAEVTCVQF